MVFDCLLPLKCKLLGSRNHDLFIAVFSVPRTVQTHYMSLINMFSNECCKTSVNLALRLWSLNIPSLFNRPVFLEWRCWMKPVLVHLLSNQWVWQGATYQGIKGTFNYCVLSLKLKPDAFSSCLGRKHVWEENTRMLWVPKQDVKYEVE